MRRAVRHLKQSDPVLQALMLRVGPCRMTFREPVFETLVRSIVFQQLSGAVATVIFNRLASAMPGARITPDSILRLRPDRLRKLGLSQQKTSYIRDLAQHTASRSIVFESLPAMADAEVIATLTKVKGIGVWTAQMFLMFALRRPDVLPVNDLGIRKAMRDVYELPELPKPRIMEQVAAPWRPYCSVACWYLWRSLDGVAGI